MILDVKIKSQLSFSEYFRLLLILTYNFKRPFRLLSPLIGIGILVFFGYVTIKYPTVDPPYTMLFMGLLIIVINPLIIYLNARRNFNSNSQMREMTTYEFSDDRMKVFGESFTGDIELRKLFKIRELKDWFVVYNSATSAYFISKTKMSQVDIGLLKTIFSQLNLSSVKLRSQSVSL